MDYDEDGKKDLLAGDQRGAVWFFRNIGKGPSPELDEGVKIEANGKPIMGTQRIYAKINGKYQVKNVLTGSSDLAEKYSKIDFADWNSDGLTDLLVGHSKGEILIYYNTGKKGAPEFGIPGLIKPQQGSFPSRPSPHVVDWDGDGKKDLLIGTEGGEIYYYPNQGTDEKPLLCGGEPLRAGGEVIQKGYRARIDIADWNNDGRLDLLVGNRDRETGGNIWLFLRK